MVQFQLPSNPDEVGRAFALANRMKHGPFDGSFRSRISQVREELSTLSGDALFPFVAENNRPEGRWERFQSSQWVFTVVELDRCWVWPRMGATKDDRKAWATGSVGQIAKQLQSGRDPGSRVWSITEHIHSIFTELPLILLRSKLDLLNRYHLDDGNHRAVAYYLAGFRQAFAYLGTPEPNLKGWDV